ncbi:unnamed protein product [Vicia faba]|uniref:Peptidylprolyl isomerase n=1 Tax=Vicia faba TaxID=3906 RepID=A0AAV0ZIJ0_VICFA|nr:unnamed protein product [Vicia faba]
MLSDFEIVVADSVEFDFFLLDLGIIGFETEYRTIHIKDGFGPPYALTQGTLEAQGTPFHNLPLEDCPLFGRGSVALIGSGPEFFINLADNSEWKQEYIVSGFVISEYTNISEKSDALPTLSNVWNGVNVKVLLNSFLISHYTASPLDQR